MTHFFFSRTRRLLFLALLPVCCSTSVRAADLTPAQLTAAFLEAFKQYAEYSSGVDYALLTVPVSDPIYDAPGFPIAELLTNQDPRFWDQFVSHLRQVLPTNSISASDFANLSQFLQEHLANFNQFSFRYDSSLRVFNPDFLFTGLGHLLVHDPVLETAVGELRNEVRIGASSIEDGIYDSNIQLMTLWQQLQDLNGSLFDWYEDWKAQRDYEATADEASVEAYQNAENEGYTAKDDDERDGTELYENAELPRVDDNYTPSIEEDSLGGSDLGLQDVDDDIIHSAVVTLVHGSPAGSRSSSILPRIEWDMGSDSALVNFATRMGAFVAWLSSTLFLLLLSYKGLHMWRVVRVGFVQAATGNEPTLHLAYNPF